MNKMMNNALLAQLKVSLQETKPRFKGVVQPTDKSFGFLTSENGLSCFLPPQMLKKVLPGDTVIAFMDVENEREFASVEQVLKSPIKEFYGVVRFRKGYALIEPVYPALPTWFRLKTDGELAEGDWIKAAVTRHPFETGIGESIFVDFIGSADDVQIPWKMAAHRYSILPPPFVDHECNPQGTEYRDLTNYPFVTIDSESTLDIDDAIYVEKLEGGYRLMVAIADPSEFIGQGSDLDLAAFERGFTTYMPGDIHSMLPTFISEVHTSLLPNTPRRAVICITQVSDQGVILKADFVCGVIKSHAKLSYAQVAQFLRGENEEPAIEDEVIRSALRIASQCANALKEHRKTSAVVANYGPDHRFVLKDFELEGIEILPRTEAHMLVEECMLATNRAYAHYSKKNGIPCIYRRQGGFSVEERHQARIQEILNFWGLVEEGDDYQDEAVYMRIMRKLTEPDYLVPSILLRRMNQKGGYTLEPSPHQGLGFPLYATFTSPIRKYTDLINHRMIKAHLAGQKAAAPTDEQIEHLNERERASRNAQNDVRRALQARYYLGRINDLHEGVVVGFAKNVLRVVDEATGASITVELGESGKGRVRLETCKSEVWVDDQCRYRLGEKVSFMVSKVNPLNGAITAMVKN